METKLTNNRGLRNMSRMVTQKELASEMGVDPSYFNQILNGHRQASWRLAKKIAIYTNTEPSIWQDDDLKNIGLRKFAVLKMQIVKRGEVYDLS